MKRSTLELLCCPRCQAALSLRDERGDETVDEGDLFCPHCERSFLIRNGIARFIDPQELEGLNSCFTRFYDWFEVSIGSGGNLPYLFESPRVGEVYGLDISTGLLACCHSYVTKLGWPVDLFLGTAEALPFNAESFDSILHIGGINFFSRKKKAIDEMIRVARPGGKIVIADESERLAQLIARIPGLSHSYQGKKADTTSIVHLVPDTMEEIRMDGIWKMHGQYHGYCLEFRKPA